MDFYIRLHFSPTQIHINYTTLFIIRKNADETALFTFVVYFYLFKTAVSLRPFYDITAGHCIAELNGMTMIKTEIHAPLLFFNEKLYRDIIARFILHCFHDSPGLCNRPQNPVYQLRTQIDMLWDFRSCVGRRIR